MIRQCPFQAQSGSHYTCLVALVKDSKPLAKGPATQAKGHGRDQFDKGGSTKGRGTSSVLTQTGGSWGAHYYTFLVDLRPCLYM